MTKGTDTTGWVCWCCAGCDSAGDGVHIMTGPIYVCGAEPGDVLQVCELCWHSCSILLSCLCCNALGAQQVAECAGATKGSFLFAASEAQQHC
jgi:acetamidase/formamidase